jgi:hypothetical protein
MDLCFRQFLALKHGQNKKIEMSLQFTLFLRSRTATVKHMYRVSFRTLYGASRMQQGFYVFISKAGGYLQKAICCVGIWTAQS